MRSFVGAVLTGFVLIAVTAVIAPSPAAAAPPEPAESTSIFAVPPSMTVSEVDSMFAVGSSVTSAKLATFAAARSAGLRDTMAGQPTPTTVEQSLTLAARAGNFGQTYDPAPSGAITAAAAKDYLTLGQCVGSGRAAQPDGWHKNHWAWCQTQTYFMVALNSKGGIVARGTFQATIIGRGYSGSRKVELDQYIAEVTLSGRWPSPPSLWVTMPCTGAPMAAKHCQVSGSRTFALVAGRATTIKYTMRSSSDNARRGAEKVSTAVFKPKYVLYSGGREDTDRGYEQGFRCDSASYLGSNGACIFDRVRGNFHLSKSDPLANEAAKHIDDALRRRSNVYPGKGTAIPATLSRMISAKGQAANNAKARASCKKKTPKKPAGKDCDEYPFKSTNQGAAKANGKYSVRYITSKDNQRAGSRLGSWYKTDRILDGDVFGVTIDK